jgi:glycosyltransferase involved in cell wall biosynthesis
MRAADVLVFPSRYEACSLVILEALASGLPVITARTAGGAEFVTPACGVVLDDPEDSRGLAEALRSLATEPQTRAAMGLAARRIAHGRSWEAMADEYLELYEESNKRRGKVRSKIVPSDGSSRPRAGIDFAMSSMLPGSRVSKQR